MLTTKIRMFRTTENNMKNQISHMVLMFQWNIKTEWLFRAFDHVGYDKGKWILFGKPVVEKGNRHG